MFYGSTHKIPVIVIAVVTLAIVIILTVMIIYSINMRTKNVYVKHVSFLFAGFCLCPKIGSPEMQFDGDFGESISWFGS